MLCEIIVEMDYNSLIYRNKTMPTVGEVRTTDTGKQIVIREITNIKTTESTIKVSYIAEDVVGKERFRIVK